ncbi:MAG: DinB family protein [Candidatus Scalinduaceae bacterium]
MEYKFLVDTYDTERIKTLSVWSMFRDEDLPIRPHPQDRRGRNAHEHMVHQCMSEDIWFRDMLGIDVGAPPLPEQETRLEFINRYAEDSGKRITALKEKDKAWWEEIAEFFDAQRSRTWIMTRRIAHTAHHRGQLTMMLRMLGREIHSTYGPSADTGGLPKNNALTIYPYPNLEALLEGEAAGGNKAPLPGPGDKPCTERPKT